MSLTFEIAGAQLIGARESQEDAFLITALGHDGDALVAVADGMGGHAAGNVASALAVQALYRHVSGRYSRQSGAELLRDGVDHANQAIAKTVNASAALKGMGCTLVGVVVSESGMQWASVGDSHLYLLRGHELRKLNADHSYGGFLDRMAALGQPLAADPGCPRHMLLSALTGEDILDVDCSLASVELRPGDRVLIASDGLNTLNHDQIVALCPPTPSPRDYADRLLSALSQARVRHQDNATVVVIEVRDGVPSASPRPASARAPEPLARPVPPAETSGSAAAREVPTTEVVDSMRRLPMADAATRPPVVNKRRAAKATTACLAIVGIAVALVLHLRLGFSGPPKQGAARGEPSVRAQAAASYLEGDLPSGTLTSPAGPHAAALDASYTRAVSAPSQAVEPQKPVPALADRGFHDPLAGGLLGLAMVWVPEGSFEMGSARLGVGPDERPRHPVHIKPFAIGRFEVMEAEYARFAAATGRKWPKAPSAGSGREPVVGIKWEDAQAYTRWLSQESGATYRLPTEAEWEYAAAAGATTPFWWGFKVLGGEAHCHGCGTGLALRRPVPVGQFKPNGFGLFDTAGNVMEWVQDCYHPSHDGAPGDGSAREEGDCSSRVARGGAFSTPSSSLRTTKRYRFDAARGYDDVGFRVVREP